MTVENTREKRIVVVSWTPPALGPKVTGYEVYVDKEVKATVMAAQNRVSCHDHELRNSCLCDIFLSSLV